MRISQAVEDYLKTIYRLELESKGEGVSTTKIANLMKVSSASVTNMIKRLAKLGMVRYESYYGTTLTDSGRKIALEIIRHHRLLELYLKEIMGYSWDQVHDEAENLEHHISEQFEDKIAELLDHPTHDPHGDPIPTKEGVIPEIASRPLTEVRESKDYLLGRVKNQDPELLRYLDDIGLIPGVRIKVLEKAPLKGPVTIEVEGESTAIGYDVATHLYVMSAKNS
ncbi:MAG: metal-dependent transcriptional regulator [Balneolaceae bacterium]